MDGNVRIDRDILIITGIAMISGLGICLLLFVSWIRIPTSAPVIGETNTPFKFMFLATEITTVDPNRLLETPETPSDEGLIVPTLPLTDVEPSAEVLVFPTQPDSVSPTPSNTLSAPVTTPVAETDVAPVDEEQVFFEGTFNDTDSRISYDGDWTSELFVASAYDETLYVSPSVGNTATFLFMGRQIVLGYLGSSEVDLGTATVLIDGKPYQMDQAGGSSWTSPQLSLVQHTVEVTHKTGDMIFIDYLEIR